MRRKILGLLFIIYTGFIASELGKYFCCGVLDYFISVRTMAWINFYIANTVIGLFLMPCLLFIIYFIRHFNRGK